MNKEFIAAIKGNRLFAKNLDDKYKRKFASIDSLLVADKESVRGYLTGSNHIFLSILAFLNLSV